MIEFFHNKDHTGFQSSRFVLLIARPNPLQRFMIMGGADYYSREVYIALGVVAITLQLVRPCSTNRYRKRGFYFGP